LRIPPLSKLRGILPCFYETALSGGCQFFDEGLDLDFMEKVPFFAVVWHISYPLVDSLLFVPVKFGKDLK
jgi:hypothetical protein